ncbi:threonine synthase [Pelagibacteraceae bacterium]|nr:threonine synthase [Pelagibacteraceae bacterium]
MEYISTRNNKKTFTFEDVFLKGLAPDGGLFIPKSTKKFTKDELKSFRNLSYQDLAKKIIFPYLGNFMPESELSDIIEKSYSVFRKDNVVHFTTGHGNDGLENVNILELFHGPTLAFKDVAMQLIGNFYEYYLKKNNKKINIIVATSGDTGAAAIEAIRGKKNMNIFVLHPHNKISTVQRKIMTTAKEQNVFNFAINGNFDDCQNLVKSMFSDQDFSNSINMSGVNSINWARIVAQAVYYFYAYFKSDFVKGNDYKELINFSVPTGNFGDVYAGYLAKKMGLPINKLIVATNKNDILHRAISNGNYEVKKAFQTLAPSMDIQIASNFERLIYDINDFSDTETEKVMNEIKKTGKYKIPKDKIEKIKKDFLSASLNEEEMKDIIHKLSLNGRPIIVDPHTAIGIGAIMKILKTNKKDSDVNINATISLATAHPAKFPEATKTAYGGAELPKELKHVMKEKENFEIIDNDLKKVKDYILNKI